MSDVRIEASDTIINIDVRTISCKLQSKQHYIMPDTVTFGLYPVQGRKQMK